jgi:hypothetical protein
MPERIIFSDDTNPSWSVLRGEIQPVGQTHKPARRDVSSSENWKHNLLSNSVVNGTSIQRRPPKFLCAQGRKAIL